MIRTGLIALVRPKPAFGFSKNHPRFHRKLSREAAREAGEEHIFPRFKKAGKLVELVDTLTTQHRAGKNAHPHDPSEDDRSKLGKRFESKEHELFGKEGFEGVVEKIAAIEKKLGIYELSRFTPS